MENNVEISIIVPIYNQEKYLKKCLDSIQSQTFSNFEVILVNDGSIDGSEEIALKYVASDSRFKYFKNENHGLSYSRNFGIQHSQGNYICFIDSDDYIDNKFLDILYNGIKKGYSICKCGFEKVYDSNYNSEEHKCIKYYEVSKEIVIKQLIDPYNPDFNDFAWNKIYDRHLFDLILFKDGACFEDT